MSDLHGQHQLWLLRVTGVYFLLLNQCLALVHMVLIWDRAHSKFLELYTQFCQLHPCIQIT